MLRGRDPNAVAVLLEDSAAVAGLLLAAGCLGLTSYTGNIIYDAIGSISIGGMDFLILRIVIKSIISVQWDRYIYTHIKGLHQKLFIFVSNVFLHYQCIPIRQICLLDYQINLLSCMRSIFPIHV